MTASCLPGSPLQLVPPWLLAAQADAPDRRAPIDHACVPHRLTPDRAAPDRHYLHPAKDVCETAGRARRLAPCNDTAERARGRTLALANPAHFTECGIINPDQNP